MEVQPHFHWKSLRHAERVLAFWRLAQTAQIDSACGLELAAIGSALCVSREER
jgi:hypothetical protein